MRSCFESRWMRALFALALTASFAAKSSAQPAAPPPPAADDPAANDPVERAIQKAVKFLYSQQNKGGHWEATDRRMGMAHADLQWGGVTAMATYGLLAAGENPQKAELARALHFLDAADVIGTYAMGMKLQSWNYIRRPTDAQKKVLKKDAEWLMNAVNGPGKPSEGLFHYTAADGTYDMSTSNYGTLGMWAAAQQNLEIPDEFWKLVDKAYRKQQNKDGGWQYNGVTNESTLSMTSAGVATMFILQEMLNPNKGDCKGNLSDDAIDRGLEWLSKNVNAGAMGNLYSMYNIERVGTASGYKYFGTVDWYKVGADWLLKHQAADGSWQGGHGGAVPGTVWGLVFLVKGRAPVMMNKLDYAIDLKGDKGKQVWNQRPRDIANLARWAGKTLEKELNWQIVNLKVDIEDLHDAPILYISGNQLINFTQAEKDKLKQYVEGGGMILGHADCNDQRFTNSFQKLGQELFPYEFRSLPADHLIYNAHFKLATRPPLRGLSNGARELMVLIPGGDPARFWQIQNFTGANMKTHSELAANIYLYAADKNTLRGKFKGQGYIVKKNDQATPAKTVKVARLEYGGNWNPEPGGWRRLANVMNNAGKLGVEAVPVKLGEGKLTADFKVAHMTGSAKFKLSDSQRKELTDFVNGGGTLVVDAAGGAVDFKDSAEAMLETMFGAAGKRGLGSALPVAHAIYTAGGDKLDRAAYRKYAQNVLVSSATTPRVRGIDVNGRTAVLYSPEDLSVGLVGMTIDGIYGYTPDYSTQLMKSILTFAANAPGGNNVAVGATAVTPVPAPAAGNAVPSASKVPETPAATPEKKAVDDPAKKNAVTKKGGPAAKEPAKQR